MAVDLLCETLLQVSADRLADALDAWLTLYHKPLWKSDHLDRSALARAQAEYQNALVAHDGLLHLLGEPPCPRVTLPAEPVALLEVRMIEAQYAWSKLEADEHVQADPVKRTQAIHARLVYHNALLAYEASLRQEAQFDRQARELANRTNSNLDAARSCLKDAAALHAQSLSGVDQSLPARVARKRSLTD